MRDLTMTEETDEKPKDEAAAPSEPIDVEAELVSETPSAAPESHADRLKGRAPLILGGALAALFVALALFALSRREEKPEIPVAAEGAAKTPVPVEIAVPEKATPLAGEKPDPAKIFNPSGADVKEGLAAVDHATPDDVISELPPAPESFGANDDLQNAAKDAAKQLAPAGDGAEAPDEIDLSSPDAGAALEKLQQGSIDAVAPTVPGTADAPAAASTAAPDALSLEVARLTGSLEVERQHTQRQEAEIARLSSELERMKAQGSPLAQSAEQALIVTALGDKARKGVPFKEELSAWERVSGQSADPALAAAAPAGLPTLSALKAGFPAMRDDALAAARRDRAKGPVSRLAANMASMVNLRPSREVAGADPAAILSRAEARLAEDNLAGAHSELAALTGAAREKAAEWMRAAERKLAADEAIEQMSAASRQALASSGR